MAISRRSARRGARPTRTAGVAAAVSGPPTPPWPTPLIGRTEEVEALSALLLRPGVRLLTLMGPPGVGKSRLAHAAVARVAGRFDFVRTLELSRLGDPDLVLPTVAHALEVHERGAPLVDVVRQVLGDRTALLLLDNYEHLLATTPQLAELLATCPGLVLLVTSRVALRVTWEHRFPILPLPVPDLARLPDRAALLQVPAVALFVERARAARPDLPLDDAVLRAVAEICVRLDGLPLAIELAAARTALLTPQQILQRLGRLDLLAGGPADLPPRQRTLQAALAWSAALLSPDELRLFRRAAVFPGGLSIAAAEVLCADRSGLDVLETLAGLVDRSLMVRLDHEGDARFGMLETVRAFAWEQLLAAGERETAQEAQARYCLTLVEEGPLPPAHRQDTFLRVAAEYDNIRTALRWAIDRREVELAARMGARLWRFWIARGQVTEGREWLGKVLAPDTGPPAALGAACYAAGMLAWHAGDYDDAEELLARSLAISRSLGEAAKVARVLNGLGLVAVRRGDLARARALYEESLALQRAGGSEHGVAVALGNLGIACGELGEVDRAAALLDEALEVWGRLGDALYTAHGLIERGKVELFRGRLEEARAWLDRGLAAFEALHEPWGQGNTRLFLAMLAHAEGDDARAADLLGESLQAYRRLASRFDTALAQQWLALVTARRAPETAGEALRQALATFRVLGTDGYLRASLLTAAVLALARGDASRAARLLGGVDGLTARLQTPLWPNLQRDLRALEQGVTTALGAAAAARLRATGRQLTVDELVALALTGDGVGAGPVEPLTVRMLGGFEVRRGETVLPASTFRRRRDRFLLCYLLLASGPVAREAVQEALWPGLGPPSARASLNVAWSNLRRAVEPLEAGGRPVYLIVEGGRYGVRREAVRTDVQQFEAMLRAAAEADSPTARAAALRGAIGLYRGDLLPEATGEPWTLVERERLRLAYIGALERLAATQQELGEPEEAVEHLRTILRLDPWREEVYRQLMRLLAGLGRRSEALRCYRECEAVLRSELEVAPSPETVRVYREIAGR